MEKTPVSLLQETMMKHGSLPQYQLLSSEQNSHLNTFRIRVRCKDQYADGIGSSKKEAKQKAAEEMLKLLKASNILEQKTLPLPVTPLSTPVKKESDVYNEKVTPPAAFNQTETSRTPSPAIVKKLVNYIGILQDHCVINKIASPVYALQSVTGVSHQPVFTVSCTVGSLTEAGSANSKQLAKHAAAEKMIKRLVGSLDQLMGASKVRTTDEALNDLQIQLMNVEIDEPKEPDVSLSEISNRYKEIKGYTRHVSTKQIPIADYHIALKRLCCDVLTTRKQSLMRLSQLNDLNSVNEIEAAINSIWSVTIKRISFATQINTTYVVGFRLDATPPMLEIGIGNTKRSAELEALLKLLQLFLTLIK